MAINRRLVGAVAVADGGVDKGPVVVGGRDSPEPDSDGAWMRRRVLSIKMNASKAWIITPTVSGVKREVQIIRSVSMARDQIRLKTFTFGTRRDSQVVVILRESTPDSARSD
jgi:GTPase